MSTPKNTIIKENLKDPDYYRKIILNNIKHDLTNPINAILGYSELIMDTILDDDKILFKYKIGDGVIDEYPFRINKAEGLAVFPDKNILFIVSDDAKRLYRLPFPITYIILPQVWAWKEKRVKILKNYVI